MGGTLQLERDTDNRLTHTAANRNDNSDADNTNTNNSYGDSTFGDNGHLNKYGEVPGEISATCVLLLCAVCCVQLLLCAVCCVLCAVCCVLCVCVSVCLCAVCCAEFVYLCCRWPWQCQRLLHEYVRDIACKEDGI